MSINIINSTTLNPTAQPFFPTNSAFVHNNNLQAEEKTKKVSSLVFSREKFLLTKGLDTYIGIAATHFYVHFSNPALIRYNKVLKESKNNPQKAVSIFFSIPTNLSPDVYSYTSLLNAYIKANDIGGACGVFNQMLAVGVQADAVTYNSLLNAYIKANDIGGVFRILKSRQSAA